MGIPVVVIALIVFYRIVSRPKQRPSVDPELAELRAAQLLNETLSAEQLKQLTCDYRIVVPSRVSGFSYDVDYQGKVRLITPVGEHIYLCIRPRGSLPPSDFVLTMVRHLQANETVLVKKAGLLDYRASQVRKHLIEELNRSQRPI